MSVAVTVRRRIARAVLLLVVVAMYGSLSGCTHKTYIEEGRGHPDYHEHHDHW